MNYNFLSNFSTTMNSQMSWKCVTWEWLTQKESKKGQNYKCCSNTVANHTKEINQLQGKWQEKPEREETKAW